MPCNRRGPSNCGCSGPPCTCLTAKRSYEGTYSALNISGPSGTFPNPCNDSGDCVISGGNSSLLIDYESNFCGESLGAFACGGGLSHCFGPADGFGVFGGPPQKVFLKGRRLADNGCEDFGYGSGWCRTVDTLPDRTCLPLHGPGNVMEYMPICQWGGGVSFGCDGGTEGDPRFALYVTATYAIFCNGGFGAFPQRRDPDFNQLPPGWIQRSPFQGVPPIVGFSYEKTDAMGVATMQIQPIYMGRPGVRWELCEDGTGGGFTDSSPPAVYVVPPNAPFSVPAFFRLSAYFSGNFGDTTIEIPELPYDPFGLMEGVSASLT